MAATERLVAADHAAIRRLLIEAQADRVATPVDLHGSEAATTATRGLCQRVAFAIDGDLLMNFRLRCRRFKLDP